MKQKLFEFISWLLLWVSLIYMYIVADSTDTNSITLKQTVILEIIGIFILATSALMIICLANNKKAPRSGNSQRANDK